MHDKWSDEEIKILKDNIDAPLKVLMELLPNRCYDGIRTKKRRLKEKIN